MSSKCIHVVTNGRISFLLLRLNNIPLHVCTTPSLSIHLSMNIWIVAMSRLLWMLLQWRLDCRLSLQDPDFSSFGSIPRNGNYETYGNSIFNFLRNLHTIFHRGCTVLHSHQQFQYLHILANTCFVFLRVAILTAVRWYYIVVFICISLRINDSEHFICIHISHLHVLFGAMSIWVLCLFFNWDFSFLLWSCMRHPCMFWKLSPYQLYGLQVFSPVS